MGHLNARAIGRLHHAPANAGAQLRGVLRTTLTTLHTWHFRARSRRRLLTLDDHLLADIGKSRQNAAREVAKPFWQE